MTSLDRAQHVAEIVKSALERTTEDARVFLEQACAGDLETRVEVDSLLKFQAQANGFIEQGALNVAAEALAQDGSLAGEQVIGGYKIFSRIGAGGMGDVYLAEDIQLRRKVALKLVRAALSTDDIVARFRHEEQILASLNDPNIAHLYGGGVAGNGIPFFVMEYVEGLRIDEYCDRHGLATAARLRLFRKVCSAVHYAHQHLVIHRDLKPSNILVTEAGEPKLLDFGIAKLLKADESAPAMTLAGAMTPDYASPEQVAGGSITTASDVYSLGVVLYKLLTGQSPYRTRTSRPDEIARAITDQDPERPSTVAANFKSLKGDLDNIALMALRKDPARRYASVAQFSEDIRRHLDGLPVIARKDTFTYRSAKFVARNRVAVAASAVVALAIIAGSIFALLSAENARRQRDVAQRERAKAERINSFLQRMLSFSNQSIDSISPVAQKKDVTVNAMLDQIVPQIETELADQPEVRAKILHTIGSAYASQGRYELAEKHLRAALATQITLQGKENPEVAATEVELGFLYYRQFNFPEASRLLEKAVAFNRRLEQTESPEFSAARLAQALEGLGSVKFYQGNPETARKLLEEALRIAQDANLQGSERTRLALIKSDLGFAVMSLGDLPKGEALMREAVAEFRQISKQPRWELGAALFGLGMAALNKNQLDEAAKFLAESEQIYRDTLGDKNMYLGGNLMIQSTVLSLKNDLQAAEKKARESVAIVQGLALSDPMALAKVRWTLGDILTKAGNAPEAEELLRQALAGNVQHSTKNIADRTGIRMSLSRALLAQDRLPEAEKIALEAYGEVKQNLGEQSPLLRPAADNLIRIYEKMGKHEAAERLK